MSLTNCRFYEEKFPEIDSFVMVNVKQVCARRRLAVILDNSTANAWIAAARSPKWVPMSSFSSSTTLTA